MKSYLKIILIVAAFALWVVFTQMSKDNGTVATSGCGCGGGTCSIPLPTNLKK